MIRFTTKVLPSQSNHLGMITLNHPKALHALTLDMIHSIQDVLLAWCHQSSSSKSRIKAILFKSSTFDGTQQKVRSFCAGGNVKDVYLAGIQPSLSPPPAAAEAQHGYGHAGLMTSDFFRQEYIMNHMLSQLNGSTVFSTLSTATGENVPRRPAPLSKRLPVQISIWDGIVMGGGVGLSIYSRYRVVTEHSIFSMPETAIGLFPDVGALYILPRVIQQYSRHAYYQRHAMNIVTYLLLTGTRLKPYDIFALGLATHYVPSNQLEELEKSLVQATADGDDDNDDDDNDDGDQNHDKKDDPNLETIDEGIDDVGPILDEFHDKYTATHPLSETSSELLPHMEDIAHVFTIDSSTTMEGIIGKLEELRSTSTFVQKTLTTILKMSPTSLKLTLMGLQRHLLSLPDTEKPTFYEELQFEYRIAQHCMKRHDDAKSDFYEGIRATLIDKDHSPKWSPSTLQDATDEFVSTTYINQSIPNEWELPHEYDLLAMCDADIKDTSDPVTTANESKL